MTDTAPTPYEAEDRTLAGKPLDFKRAYDEERQRWFVAPDGPGAYAVRGRELTSDPDALPDALGRVPSPEKRRFYSTETAERFVELRAIAAGLHAVGGEVKDTAPTPEPFPIVDGAFTVPERNTDRDDFASMVVRALADGSLSLRVPALHAVRFRIAAPDLPAFIESLCALTGYARLDAAEIRRKALEDAHDALVQVGEDADPEKMAAAIWAGYVAALLDANAAIRALAEREG